MVKIFSNACLMSIIFTINVIPIPPFLEYTTEWPEKILSSLTLREKIGQLFVIAAASNFNQPTEMLASSMQASPYNMTQQHVTNMIKNYHVGGIIFLYKSDPETQIRFTNIYKEVSKIPLLIAQDSEWGLSMRLDMDPTKVVRYPRNMTLGAITDEHLIYQLGYEIGQQCAAIGVHMNCAPVVDVNNNAANPVIHDRSFGDDPQKVAQLSILFMRGLQDAGVIACAKHFPGHGDTTIDSHLDLPIVSHDITRLNAIELLPFKKNIAAGVSAIMMAHLCVPVLDAAAHKPSSMSYAIITNMLKHNLNFNGLVVTDGLGMSAITKHYQPGELELQAFLAGNDILLCPLDVPRAIDLIEQAIKNGQISEEELNQRVMKILRSKAWVFDQQKKLSNGFTIDNFLIRPAAYALQKKLYQHAITYAKKDNTLPFNFSALKNSCIIQIGTLPENLFAREIKKYTNMINMCPAHISQAEMNECLNSANRYNTIIVAIGNMHKNVQQKYGISDETVQLLEKFKNLNKKVIVILFGTPYSLAYIDRYTDTIVVAYEDIPIVQTATVDMLTGLLEPQGILPIHYSFS